MKKQLAIVLALASTSAYADTSNFEGFEAGLGLGYVNADMDFADSRSDRMNWDKDDAVVQVSVAYHWPINENWLIGLGATYDLNDTDASTQIYRSEDISAELQHHSSIYVQPTYVIDDRSAVFAKVGYHKARTNTTGPSSVWIEDNITVEGIGYSLGYKRLIQNNLFIQGELLFVHYDDEQLGGGAYTYEYEQETRSAVVTLGYQF
jgi:lipopolysaccharide assembly outer membrane protein LptD (OstA)